MNYRKAIVSYVDILGFRNLVATATVDEVLDVLSSKSSLTLHWDRDTAVELLVAIADRRVPMEEVHETARHFREASREVDQNTFTGFTVSFSDLIVNVTPLDTIQPLHGLFNDIATLGWRQFMLAIRGIFVRGGVTLGDIYVDSRTIFGPALIQAYDIERTTAKWPIIAIDPQLIRTLKGMARRYYAERRRSDRDESWLAKAFLGQFALLFKKTEEGTYFLDYLSCFAYHDLATGDLRYYLQDHRDSVKKAHARYAHWKYSFVAQYHDAYCRKCFPDDSTLLIGALP
jgi:hypothetical protein